MGIFIGCKTPLCKKLMACIVHTRPQRRNENPPVSALQVRHGACPVSALISHLGYFRVARQAFKEFKPFKRFFGCG
jgi:hypothetical protein